MMILVTLEATVFEVLNSFGLVYLDAGDGRMLEAGAKTPGIDFDRVEVGQVWVCEVWQPFSQVRSATLKPVDQPQTIDDQTPKTQEKASA